LGGIFGGLPREAEKSTMFNVFRTFWSLCLMIFERFVVVLGAAAARARTLKNQVFAWRVCRISVFGVFRARPEKRKRDEKQHRKQHQKASQSERKSNRKKQSKMIIFGAKMAPKIDPGGCRRPLGHQVGRKMVPKVAWVTPGRPKRRFGRMSGAI
jgi:hypothetical protein